MLDIGMSELLDFGVNDNGKTARTPLSGTYFYNEKLDADSINYPRSSRLGCDPLDVRVVVRKYPQSEVSFSSTSLNVSNGFVVETPKHQELDFLDVRAVAV